MSANNDPNVNPVIFAPPKPSTAHMPAGKPHGQVFRDIKDVIRKSLTYDELIDAMKVIVPEHSGITYHVKQVQLHSEPEDIVNRTTRSGSTSLHVSQTSIYTMEIEIMFVI